MLVLARKKSQTVLIDGHIEIQILQTSSGSVKLGITAPRSVRVVRGELEVYPEMIPAADESVAVGLNEESDEDSTSVIATSFQQMGGAGFSTSETENAHESAGRKRDKRSRLGQKQTDRERAGRKVRQRGPVYETLARRQSMAYANSISAEPNHEFRDNDFASDQQLDSDPINSDPITSDSIDSDRAREPRFEYSVFAK